jgi:hypothetical protein
MDMLHSVLVLAEVLSGVAQPGGAPALPLAPPPLLLRIDAPLRLLLVVGGRRYRFELLT